MANTEDAVNAPGTFRVSIEVDPQNGDFHIMAVTPKGDQASLEDVEAILGRAHSITLRRLIRAESMDEFMNEVLKHSMTSIASGRPQANQRQGGGGRAADEE